MGNSGKKSLGSLPIVSAADVRTAMPGEMWERSPASLVGPFSQRSLPRGDSGEAVTRLVEEALSAPIDFPGIGDAILPGDHVTLAVDPSTPMLVDVVRGVIQRLQSCDVGRVSITLWPEAPDDLLFQLRSCFENTPEQQAWAQIDGLPVDGVADEHSQAKRLPSHSQSAQSSPSMPLDFPVNVTRHAPRQRASVRYIAADEAAEAVYIARDLVDADFTLPITTVRVGDAIENVDKAGVFPMFADAATARRYCSQHGDESTDVGWLLGVQLLVAVSANAAGGVGRVLAGTPNAIREELQTLHAEGESLDESETLPRADLVIAVLDGDVHAQTWQNVARAIVAGSRHVQPGGAIVVWSRLDDAPSVAWQACFRELDEEVPSENSAATDPVDAGEFEPGEPTDGLVRRAAQISRDTRVMLHSQRPAAEIESLGFGVVESVEQLRTLGERFASAGVLRATQFQCASVLVTPENSKGETH